MKLLKLINFWKKKSVTFKLQNGTKVKAEDHLYSILNIRDTGEIYISDRYTNKTIEGTPIEYCKSLATELKSIKYGKNVLEIDSKALSSLKLEERQEEQTIEDEEDEEEF